MRNLAALLVTGMANLQTPERLFQSTEATNSSFNPASGFQGKLTIDTDVTTQGLVYSLSGGSIKLAIIILIFHIAIATASISVSVVLGKSSRAWTSVSEITALALNSDLPRTMESTSGGIETIGVFRQPVSIRAREGSGARIVFEDDEKKRNDQHELIGWNKKY